MFTKRKAGEHVDYTRTVKKKKSAGKPQWEDGIESASVSADARSSFQHMSVPKHCQHQGVEPVLLVNCSCVYFLV